MKKSFTYLLLLIGFVQTVSAQVYFNTDIHFPAKQSEGRSVFITPTGYTTISGYSHDINIPGNFKDNNEVVVFSAFNQIGDTVSTKKYESPDFYSWLPYASIRTYDSSYMTIGWINLDTINYT